MVKGMLGLIAITVQCVTSLCLLQPRWTESSAVKGLLDLIAITVQSVQGTISS